MLWAHLESPEEPSPLHKAVSIPAEDFAMAMKVIRGSMGVKQSPPAQRVEPKPSFSILTHSRRGFKSDKHGFYSGNETWQQKYISNR